MVSLPILAFNWTFQERGMLIVTLQLQRILGMWLALRQAETARVLDELLVRRLRLKIMEDSLSKNHASIRLHFATRALTKYKSLIPTLPEEACFRRGFCLIRLGHYVLTSVNTKTLPLSL